MASPTKKRSPNRYARLYALTASLGMDEMDIKSFLHSETGKESKRLLTDEELEAACRELEQRRDHGRVTHPARPKGSYRRYSHTPGGMSEGQQDKVWALMYQLRKYDQESQPVPLGKRLAGIIKRELMMDATPEEPFRWLSCEDGSKLIDVIKGYVETEKRKTLVMEKAVAR